MNRLLFAAALASAAPLTTHADPRRDPGLSAATTAQLDTVADAVARYRDFAVARREGWQKFGGDEPLMGEHWHHPAGPDYAGSDARLDFTRPSNLMYTMIAGKRVLTGVAFTVRIGVGEPVPEGFAGTADRWHAHDFLKAIEAALIDRPLLRWLANGWIDANYRNKGDNRGRVAMVHAWVTLPNPDGVFADYNRTLPYLKLGLPVRDADGASVDAARGLDLLAPDGCTNRIDGVAWIANLSAATRTSLHARCAAEVATIRASFGQSAGALNAAAAAGYQRFDRFWQARLTPAQAARAATMTEHGAHAVHGSTGMNAHEGPDMPGMTHDH